MDERISELIANLGDDEQTTLSGSQLRTYAEETNQQAKTEAEEAAARQYAEHVRSELPAAMAGALESSGIRVGRTRSPYEAYTDDTAGVAVGMTIRAVAAARGNWEEAQKIMRSWVEALPTPEGEQAIRALTEGDFDSAGSFVQEQYSTDIIMLLRNRTVIRQAGVRTLPLPQGNLTIHKITGGAQAFYRGEGESVAPSTITTGQMRLSIKELVGRIPISKRLLRHASPAVDTMARNDLVDVLAEKEDLTFLRSPGGQNAPRGLRYLINAANIAGVADETAPDVAETKLELSKMVLALKNANIPMRNVCWFFSYRTEEYLINLLDGNGRPVFENEMLERGTLRGKKYFATNQIPDNLGVGTNESEIYLVDMSETFIGEEGKMEITVANDVTYSDANGQLHSAFDLDETVIQAVQYHDFGMRYDKAGYVGTAVKWGA